MTDFLLGFIVGVICMIIFYSVVTWVIRKIPDSYKNISYPEPQNPKLRHDGAKLLQPGKGFDISERPTTPEPEDD